MWTPVLTSDTYHKYLSRSAKSFADAERLDEHVTSLAVETLKLADALTFDIPGFDWTIEVDIAGKHRITIHFKGAQISLDAIDAG